MIKAISINKKKIYPFKSKETFLNFIEDKKCLLIAINAEKILNKNIQLSKIINQNIGYPDGVGAVLALKRNGHSAIKIAGAEFWLDIISYFPNKTFYFVGATPEVISKTVEKLKKQFREIKILGYRDGFLDKNDIENLKETLKKQKPDVVFVAQGSPKQELLMQELNNNFPAIYMGLGGSFDVYTGKVKRAPKIFINFHLEWFYRLIKQPSRWKRQLKVPLFLLKVIFNKY